MQQRALFVVPRSFPSFISTGSRLSSGPDHRIQHHVHRTIHVAHRASSHLPAVNNNPFKLHANNGSSNEMSTTSTHNNYYHNSGTNQQSLMEQLAIRLVQGNNDDVATSPPPKNNVLAKPIKACIAVAGGGSNAASSIASIPGASSILLESIVTYDRRSFAEYVTQNIAQVDNERWLVDLENIATETGGTSTGDDSSSTSSRSNQRTESFQFCSMQAAVLLSRSSLHRTIQLTPSFQDRCLHCVGVGCTSALVGKTSSDGGENTRRNGRKSKAYIAYSTVQDGTWVWELELDSGSSSSNGEIAASRRSRSQEEAVISNVILLTMIRYRELKSLRPLDGNVDDDYNQLLSQILDRKGDALSVKKIDYLPTDDDGEVVGKSAAFGASQIINGNANVIAVLPVPCDEPLASSHHDEEQDLQPPVIRMETLSPENNTIFPRDVLIVPGSFNPPHHGHIGLANAAVLALRRLRRAKTEETDGSDACASSSSLSRSLSHHSSLSSRASSSSSSILRNLWSTVDRHSDDQYDPTVFFELSVTNADKPPLDPMEVERRINIFTSLPRQEMPRDWAVMLTNAPLFSQKTDILAELIPNNRLENEPSSRTMSFVLGTDTMVRIINPKYYDNSREKMLAALMDMKEKGVHFIVGGRLEPGTNNYMNGKDEVSSLPLEVQEMFTLLPEDEFRMDISSTELRKRLSEQNQ
ncbi:hypothetical protein ACHAXH_009079 [Discostella pseudostelligera]